MRVAEYSAVVTLQSSLKRSNELEIREESLFGIDVLTGMGDCIFSTRSHLHLVMRELEGSLLVWSLSFVERQSHSTCLEVNEMKRVCPCRHLILQSICIEVDSVLKE